MKHILAEAFEHEVMLSAIPVLLDFFTDGCAPCRSLAPILEQLEQERAGKLKVIQMDACQEAEFAARFHVMTVPTLLLFQHGRCVAQRSGLCNRKELQAWLDEA